jgi:hypothetical protein
MTVVRRMSAEALISHHTQRSTKPTELPEGLTDLKSTLVHCSTELGYLTDSLFFSHWTRKLEESPTGRSLNREEIIQASSAVLDRGSLIN